MFFFKARLISPPEFQFRARNSSLKEKLVEIFYELERNKRQKTSANSGTHSFYNLFVTLMGMEVASSGLTKGDSGIQSEPYLFPRSGGFNWYSSGLVARGSSGYYWSSHTYSKTRSHDLLFDGSRFYPQDGGYKGYGFAVRWGYWLVMVRVVFII